MSRPHAFPDSDNRSKNNPSIIVESGQVLEIYNRNSEEENRMKQVTKKVQDWFRDPAKSQEWDNAAFCGNQCILTNTQRT